MGHQGRSFCVQSILASPVKESRLGAAELLSVDGLQSPGYLRGWYSRVFWLKLPFSHDVQVKIELCAVPSLWGRQGRGGLLFMSPGPQPSIRT